jgi:hypothetical protein
MAIFTERAASDPATKELPSQWSGSMSAVFRLRSFLRWPCVIASPARTGVALARLPRVVRWSHGEPGGG